MPGLHERDMDGDGRVLTMRIPDTNGAWMESAADARIMRPVPFEGAESSTARYRLLYEGEVVDHDGFTIPTPRPPEGLDMNRNFPAGWGTGVRGSGDHPLSEPEIDALVRAAERATVIQCIACGAPATINDHGGWYLALCDRHAHQRRTVQMTSWKFLQEVALFPTEEL
jgi:hypothetical protein